MAQGKLKLKAKLPQGVKKKPNKKGKAITKRANCPIQPKKFKQEETNKLKKIITRTVNKAVEEEIRGRAIPKKKKLSKAEEAVVKHNQT